MSNFTLRSSGVLLLASAAFELFSVTDGVALFGVVRVGLPAIVYHGLYVILFAMLGIGLWELARWTPSLTVVTTVVYTLDQVRILLDPLSRQNPLAGFVDSQMLNSITLLVSALSIAAWWGFTLYVWWRREAFLR